MSAPLQSSFLENLLGSVNNTSFALPYPTAGSGSGGFLAGLDFSSILGGGANASGAGGALGGLGSLASLLGPIGAGLGVVTNLIPGLDGFLQNGFDFTCIGSQAFNKGDLDQKLNELKSEAEKGKSSVAAMGQLLYYLYDNIQLSNIEIGRYSSGCSKSLRTKFRDSVQQIFDSIDKSNFTVTSWENTDWKGQKYTVQGFTPKNTASSQVPNIASITPEIFEMQVKPEVVKYALANGLNPTEEIKKVELKLFPNGVGGSGGVVFNEDGTVDWNVQAGNTNKPDYVKMSLIGLAVLVAYKFLIKK